MNPTRQQLRAEARGNEFRAITAQFPAEPRLVPRTIALKRARTRWMRLVTALASFVAIGTLSAIGPSTAQAQGSRKDDIVFNSRGVPLAGAQVRVCAMPASGQPCTPLALIYSDSALTQALSNPTTTDGLGNYFFFATPGKYLIEVSGPGIITKQFPNVILPSDPTSPTFSSITSTSNISGFSLTLTGNLTVNGPASVLGNLAFGAAQLTNQAIPPGTPPSGVVNLYTKTVDKRLYYKDDTGAEIGPIANTTGAQTNITNTFTADQNVDANLRVKGPSPWYDVTRYGVRAVPPGGFPFYGPTTTATTVSGNTVVTVADGSSFINGDGIVIHLAGGPDPTLGTGNQSTISAISRTANVVTVTTQQARRLCRGANGNNFRRYRRSSQLQRHFYGCRRS